MCRFAAYFGENEILLDEIIAKPQNSLIKQSHEAREGVNGVNADGFGLAWYNFDIDSTPGVFRSTQPAWNDNNLIHLSQKVRSQCFLSHVRASTVGDVTTNNCHPFSHGDYTFVHNGTIRNFDRCKRKLVDEIDEALFLNIRGNTDSECFFFLIMHYVQQDMPLVAAVKKAIAWVVACQKDGDDFSRLNIAITNGQEIMATRFVSKDQKSLSLKYLPEEGAGDRLASLILSSEALDNDANAWHDVDENSYIYLRRDDMRPQLGALDV